MTLITNHIELIDQYQGVLSDNDAFLALPDATIWIATEGKANFVRTEFHATSNDVAEAIALDANLTLFPDRSKEANLKIICSSLYSKN